MRMAFFHPAFENVGGAEILAAMQLRYLRAQGVQADLVTLAFDPGRWQPRLPEIPVEVVTKRHWADPFVAWSRLAKIKRRAKRALPALREYDVVIAHNYPCNAMLGYLDLPGRKIWQCNEPPRGLHLREANPVLAARVEATAGKGIEDACTYFAAELSAYDRELASKGSLSHRRAFDLVNGRRLDHIYAISAFSRDNARRLYGKCDEEVLYPMVRFPQGGMHRSGLDRAGLQILVHSRLEVLKNIDTVIRGFTRFLKECPGARLHVVGEGAHRKRLETLARELCPDRATFHGYLSDEDLRKVYEACDVFALPTLDEPFGMVFPEAAAKGLLLVGPDHGGPLEIMDGGRLGWATDPFDPGAIAGAFSEIWSLGDAEVDRRRTEADAACRSRYAEEVIGPQLLRMVRGA